MVFVLVCSFITVVVVRPVLASDFRVQTSSLRWMDIRIWMDAGCVLVYLQLLVVDLWFGPFSR